MKLFLPGSVTSQVCSETGDVNERKWETLRIGKEFFWGVTVLYGDACLICVVFLVGVFFGGGVLSCCFVLFSFFF